jgi:hypothetical protein
MTLSLLEFLKETQSPELMIWDYVSPSRLNLWMKCPLAFRRKYIDGIEIPTSPNLFVGKVTHDVLDAVYRCRMVGAFTTADDVPQFVDDAWKRTMVSEPCTFDDGDHEAKCRSQVADLVRTYISETDITSEKPLAVEQKYEVPLVDPLTGEDLGVPLLGVIDLVLEGEDGPVVIDFKTAASASYCDLTHELQLTAYSYLIREALGREESALEVRQLVKTKTPKIVTHRFPPRTDEHFERFFGLVREYLNALDRKIFNYRPSWNCGMCEHSVTCAC